MILFYTLKNSPRWAFNRLFQCWPSIHELLFCYKCFPDSVDLRTKRRAFDLIMSLRRLQEEKKILITEMKNHWNSLSARGDSLQQLSCLVSGATVQGMYLQFYRARLQICDDEVTNTDLYYLAIHHRFSMEPKWGWHERSAEPHQKKAAEHQGHECWCEKEIFENFARSRDQQLIEQCIWGRLFRQWVGVFWWWTVTDKRLQRHSIKHGLSCLLNNAWRDVTLKPPACPCG